MSSLQLQKLRISIKAYESELLNSSCNKIIEAVKASDTKVIGPIPLPTKVRRYCVLTSPHVNKMHVSILKLGHINVLLTSINQWTAH